MVKENAEYQRYRQEIKHYRERFFDCQYHSSLSVTREKDYRETKSRRDFAQALNENRLAYHLAKLDTQLGRNTCDIRKIRAREVELLTQYRDSWPTTLPLNPSR